MNNDREILETAFQTLASRDPQNARIVHIENTLKLEEMYISESLIPEAQEIQNISIIGTPTLMEFDESGNIDYSF